MPATVCFLVLYVPESISCPGVFLEILSIKPGFSGKMLKKKVKAGSGGTYKHVFPLINNFLNFETFAIVNLTRFTGSVNPLNFPSFRILMPPSQLKKYSCPCYFEVFFFN